MESDFEPCPENPCEHCIGHAATPDRFDEAGNPVYLTSWEWCQRMNACAATIDWEKVAGR